LILREIEEIHDFHGSLCFDEKYMLYTKKQVYEDGLLNVHEKNQKKKPEYLKNHLRA
jgi:hypothetical protein